MLLIDWRLGSGNGVFLKKKGSCGFFFFFLWGLVVGRGVER